MCVCVCECTSVRLSVSVCLPACLPAILSVCVHAREKKNIHHHQEINKKLAWFEEGWCIKFIRATRKNHIHHRSPNGAAFWPPGRWWCIFALSRHACMHARIHACMHASPVASTWWLRHRRGLNVTQRCLASGLYAHTNTHTHTHRHIQIQKHLHTYTRTPTHTYTQ